MQRQWYGHETLLADVAVIPLAYATKNVFVLAGGYSLASPIVHWANGQTGKGFVSLLLRGSILGLTALSASFMASGDADERDARLAPMLLGVTAVLAFPIVDSCVLAYKDRSSPPPVPSAPSADSSMLRVVPAVGWTPSGGYAGLAGIF
ncbi:MAG: hypothetical protein HY898_10825 [Deltaproteobacteria bacterium]|nr:hypothetical protein [Deltaproteobacteria bacterium]